MNIPNRAVSIDRWTAIFRMTIGLYLGVSLTLNDAYANPQGGNVVAGQVTIMNTSNLTSINQSTNKAIINWQSFNINSNEHTKFIQPSKSSWTLNRVGGVDPSSILGKLSANGQIMLVNPAGIVFGQGSSVDVAGIVATTANISNQNC